MNQPDVPAKDLNFKTYPIDPKELLTQLNEYISKMSYLDTNYNKINSNAISLKYTVEELKTINYLSNQTFHWIALQIFLNSPSVTNHILDYHSIMYTPSSNVSFIERMESYGLKYLSTFLKKKELDAIISAFENWKNNREYLDWFKSRSLENAHEGFKYFKFIDAKSMVCKPLYENIIFSILKDFVPNEDYGYLNSMLKEYHFHPIKVYGSMKGFLNILKYLYDEKYLFPDLSINQVSKIIQGVFINDNEKDLIQINHFSITKEFIQFKSANLEEKETILMNLNDLKGVD